MTNKEPLKPLIPEGDYCYKHTGRVLINNRATDSDGNSITIDYHFIPEIKLCPFWKYTNTGAYCSYMEIESERGGINLIWDQVKECGVNESDLNLFEEEEKRLSPMMAAEKRQKKTPLFMESLIGILLDSVNNELVYDGITYTLSQSIIDELN